MRSPTSLPTWRRAALALLAMTALGATAAAQPRTTVVGGPAFRGVPVGVTSAGVRSVGALRTYQRGRYETRYQQVWVPGRQEQVWVEPLHEWRRDVCGRRYRVEVRPGHFTLRHVPGRYETRAVRVWVPARSVVVRPRFQRVTHVGRRACP